MDPGNSMSTHVFFWQVGTYPYRMVAGCIDSFGEKVRDESLGVLIIVPPDQASGRAAGLSLDKSIAKIVKQSR